VIPGKMRVLVSVETCVLHWKVCACRKSGCTIAQESRRDLELSQVASRCEGGDRDNPLKRSHRVANKFISQFSGNNDERDGPVNKV
jgi:hypothetical protein